ncbi:MAG: hypothetical protein LBD29_08785 [Treponema sp.]|jgi:hypothetical protein|nr:hypothetical protein [Treponema sp.]
MKKLGDPNTAAIIRKLFICLFFIILIGAGIGIFLLRDPVLIVTDNSFNALYGILRSRLKAVETSIILFRPVKPVLIGDNASPEMVAFAVEEVKGSPYCILFPYRYNEGAERYAAQHPQVSVFILGERNQASKSEGAVFVETDVKRDLYRAGLCAGSIAGSMGKEILFFQNETLSEEQREMFQAGLREQGIEEAPIYLSVSQEYSDNQNVACVVMNGQASQFLDQNLETPIILFSWIDPGLTATSVKVVFDDSPWALVTRVVQMIIPGKNPEKSISSEITILGRRISDKGILRHLKNVRHNIPNI